MVTESELRAGSRLVASHARTVGMMARTLPGWIDETGLVGGTHQPQIVAGLAAQRGRAASLADTLDGLARELEQRADLIANYRIQLAGWEADLRTWDRQVIAHLAASGLGVALPHPGAAPPRPQPPFPEAEVG